MISDNELVRQEPKVGDLFFWRDDNDNIQMNVMTEVDIKKKLAEIYFSLLIDRHGAMRDMTVNKGGEGKCLVDKTEKIVSMFNNDALDLDGCKIKELEQQWGWKVIPEMSYSFHIYTDDSWVADQLKSLIRRKFGVVCAKAPYTAEVVLAKHKEKIYDHLRQFLPRLPQIREDYFNRPPPPPPDKLENARPLPPLQNRPSCQLCGVMIRSYYKSIKDHMDLCHYSGPNALTCDLCSCSFAIAANLRTHHFKHHAGAKPQKRTRFGIVDISDEDAQNCDVHLDSIPQEEGSKKTRYRCTWVRENKQECGQLTSGISNAREHVCTHLKLRPYTCPMPGCTHSAGAYNTVVRQFKAIHEGQEEQDDEENDEPQDEPPKKKTK
ncbi:uncharacterized protein LOC110843824 [Folsomia candida]|uniref:uncharacterized protein LOC110843824 n=1 Tax=Folsomia candida TaxID=158441 RepID=UPI000B8FCE7B|nr:uncharacterized protein LOC110843824 [Folsomia candida]XP_035703632.1 uncharacterized protein LOC110843824 [Folsomia candida]XP_035703634.1 uncharacterized protein LOC110843824 [Folsomia candida]XP_035703635.1 uncharacterized protein LOC110843824 [Folsomia candida]